MTSPNGSPFPSESFESPAPTNPNGDPLAPPAIKRPRLVGANPQHHLQPIQLDFGTYVTNNKSLIG